MSDFYYQPPEPSAKEQAMFDTIFADLEASNGYPPPDWVVWDEVERYKQYEREDYYERLAEQEAENRMFGDY